MKKVITIIGIFGLIFVQAQVGINTDTPQATLDIKSEVSTPKALKITNSANAEIVTVTDEGRVIIDDILQIKNINTTISSDYKDKLVAVDKNGVVRVTERVKPFVIVYDESTDSGGDDLNFYKYGTASTWSALAYYHLSGTIEAPLSSQPNTNNGGWSSNFKVQGNAPHQWASVNVRPYYRGDGNTKKTALAFYVSDDKLPLYLHEDNKVGIGTTAPTEKLHVIGNIKASGTITPDYVFQKYYDGHSSLKADYQMMSLSEVEAFTREYKHLPGVPSASEVKKSGGILVNRATEINLEKIEELYLHTIEQDKKIKTQQKRIEKLESLVQQLLKK